jgi:hypothetical protein
MSQSPSSSFSQRQSSIRGKLSFRGSFSFRSSTTAATTSEFILPARGSWSGCDLIPIAVPAAAAAAATPRTHQHDPSSFANGGDIGGGGGCSSDAPLSPTTPENEYGTGGGAYDAVGGKSFLEGGQENVSSVDVKNGNAGLAEMMSMVVGPGDDVEFVSGASLVQGKTGGFVVSAGNLFFRDQALSWVPSIIRLANAAATLLVATEATSITATAAPAAASDSDSSNHHCHNHHHHNHHSHHHHNHHHHHHHHRHHSHHHHHRRHFVPSAVDSFRALADAHELLR